MSSFDGDWGAEAGLLFQGIRDGWESFDEWKQSPVLRILKAVDQFLFVKKNGRMERLAASYKSFKLLKVGFSYFPFTLSSSFSFRVERSMRWDGW